MTAADLRRHSWEAEAYPMRRESFLIIKETFRASPPKKPGCSMTASAGVVGAAGVVEYFQGEKRGRVFL